MDYQEIIKAELLAHDITVCAGCDNYHSHSRGFAIPDKREIHYNAKGSTRSTLYGFLHEIGHIVMGHGKQCPLRRYEREAQAEQYARDSFRDYGIPTPRKVVALGKRYVKRMKQWGRNIANAHHHSWQFVRKEGNQVFQKCACGTHGIRWDKGE